MGKYLQLWIGFSRHPKFAELADADFRSLLTLWDVAASTRPDGDLSRFSDAAIDRMAGWPGATERLAKVGFIDGKPGSRRLHNWAERQPWICGTEARHRAAMAGVEGKRRKRQVLNTQQVSTVRSTDCSRVVQPRIEGLKEGKKSDARAPARDPQPRPLTPATSQNDFASEPEPDQNIDAIGARAKERQADARAALAASQVRDRIAKMDQDQIDREGFRRAGKGALGTIRENLKRNRESQSG